MSAFAGIKKATAPKIILIWLAGAVFLTYSGPFGTYQRGTLLELFVTWVVLLGVSMVAVFIVHELCETLMSNAPPLLCNAVFIALSSLIVGLLVDLMLTYWFAQESTNRPSHARLTLYAFFTMSFLDIVRHAFFPSQPVLRSVPHETEDAAQDTAVPTSLPAHSRLAKRLDIPRESRIIHITAKGHFVEVQTCSDTYRTRMRFLDAVDELDGSLGLTVHRSHWVHRDAIEGWTTEAKKPYVLLKNGNEVPISKTNLSKVEQAGLAKLELAS